MEYLVYGGTLAVLTVIIVYLWLEHRRFQIDKEQSLFALKDIFERTYPNENTLFCSMADLRTRKKEEETAAQKGYLVLSDMGVYFFVVDEERNKLNEEIAQTWGTVSHSRCLGNVFQIDLSGYSCFFGMNKDEIKQVEAVISGLPSTG